jgi:hypothetical protein
MATLPKVLISRADYQIGGGVALRLRTQASDDLSIFLHVHLAARNHFGSGIETFAFLIRDGHGSEGFPFG